MRFILSRLFILNVLFSLLLAGTAAAQTQSEASNLFPKTVGEFRAQGAQRDAALLKEMKGEDFRVQAGGETVYVSPKGERLVVTLLKTESQAGAYALLSEVAAQMRSRGEVQATKQGEVGVAGVASADRLAFYKGRAFVSVTGKLAGKADGLKDFSRAFAATLEDAENEIPVLVKHLPDWERAQERAIYAVTPEALQKAAEHQPVLDAISFEGGAEAVTAPYDRSRLVVVEFTTPQIAASNDERINERIKQLRESNQTVPAAYRRVGNYSVFVFNAPDETAANKLIDEVKYEQSIQWLGENPLAWARAEKQHTRDAVGLILGIAKTIGFFVAICLGGGGVVGGIAYLRRRRQQRQSAATATTTAAAYSDAGGMLRLNLDEVTPATDPARLLGSGDRKPVA